jgi:hypothetical protein
MKVDLHIPEYYSPASLTFYLRNLFVAIMMKNLELARYAIFLFRTVEDYKREIQADIARNTANCFLAYLVPKLYLLCE